MENQIDSSHFKPLNSGLGFHHTRKLKTKKDGEEQIIQSFNFDPALDTAKIPSTLSPFYTNGEKAQDIGVKDYKAFEDFDEETYIQASPTKRLMAWMLDTIIIALLCGSVLALIMLANSFNFAQMLALLKETPIRWIFLFVLINMFYFTLLEKSPLSTIGKFLLGLQVKVSDNSRLTLDHTLVRSAVGIGNIITFGFLAIFSFQDKISETMVLEK